MNYWNDMSERVRNILAARPNLEAYSHEELFSRWVMNLTPTARGLICNVPQLRGSAFCAI